MIQTDLESPTLKTARFFCTLGNTKKYKVLPRPWDSSRWGSGPTQTVGKKPLIRTGRCFQRAKLLRRGAGDPLAGPSSERRREDRGKPSRWVWQGPRRTTVPERRLAHLPPRCPSGSLMTPAVSNLTGSGAEGCPHSKALAALTWFPEHSRNVLPSSVQPARLSVRLRHQPSRRRWAPQRCHHPLRERKGAEGMWPRPTPAVSSSSSKCSTLPQVLQGGTVGQGRPDTEPLGQSAKCHRCLSLSRMGSRMVHRQPGSYQPGARFHLPIISLSQPYLNTC